MIVATDDVGCSGSAPCYMIVSTKWRYFFELFRDFTCYFLIGMGKITIIGMVGKKW